MVAVLKLFFLWFLGRHKKERKKKRRVTCARPKLITELVNNENGAQSDRPVAAQRSPAKFGSVQTPDYSTDRKNSWKSSETAENYSL